MKKYALLLVVLLLIVVAVVMYHRHRHTTTPTIHTIQPTTLGPGFFRTQDGVLMPNPALTPGEVRTTDADEVCHESARAYRHTPDSLKLDVYRAYGVTPHEGVCADTERMTKGRRKHPPHLVTESCEEDHLISLELGGADTRQNLWIQPYNPPNGLGAHAKDRVENYLHHHVCVEHDISLPDAQRAIATDWYQVYKRSIK